MSASSTGREHGEDEETVEQRWILGPARAGVPPESPLSTAARTLPPGVSTADLARYCLMLGDDALVLSQRLAGWIHRSPELEEDTAIGRVVVDLLEQARALLARSGEVAGDGWDEDRLAHERPPEQFRNVRLTEIDCGPAAGGGFEASIAQLLVCATWRTALFRRLTSSADPVLAALATENRRELAWHGHHAALWVIRLGDAGPDSRARMLAGLDRVWPMTGELFARHPVETRLARAGVAVDPATLRPVFTEMLDEVLSVARLAPVDPRRLEAAETAGRDGVHTESLGFLLADSRAAGGSLFDL